MTDSARDPVTAWAEAVDAGRIVAGPHVRNTARRHLRDLDQGHHRGLVFDSDAARDIVEWFPRRLRLNGGDFEGRPFHLHESQAFRVGSIFGWKWKETGLRRFRRFY
ncbi:terminase large subunit, partial [Lysobacter sp. TAB13]